MRKPKLKRRTRRKLIVLLIALVLVLGGIFLHGKFNPYAVYIPGVSSIVQTLQQFIPVKHSAPAPIADRDMSKFRGPYDVVRVVDGDTAVININGEEKRCRFIGIDTPESVHPDAQRNIEEGKAASDYTKELLSGQQVYLEYDLAPQDQYGRELVYLYLKDGQMIQEILLKNGLAVTMTIQPNSKYASYFAAIQAEAREIGAGFWAATEK